MSSINYELKTDLCNISAWYGAEYFEITSYLFPSRSRNESGGTAGFDRKELEEFSKIINKVLEETKDMGYYEVRGELKKELDNLDNI